MHAKHMQHTSKLHLQALFMSSNHPVASIVEKKCIYWRYISLFRHNLALPSQNVAKFAVIGGAIEPIWLGNTLSKHGLSIWWMGHYNLDSNQHMW